MKVRLIISTVGVLGSGLLLPLADPGTFPLPPPVDGRVSFQSDIQPLLEARCVQCHGRGKAKGGLSLETREKLLQGGASGPVVVPGNSGQSYLIALVAAVDPDNVMPIKGTRLTAEEVGILRAWIDGGLDWDPSISLAKPPPRNLLPRHPEVPDLPQPNPIDRFLAPYLEAHGVDRLPNVDDRVFARRVYLDVWGLLPSPEELAAFVSDPDPMKRERLVEGLLAEPQRYAEHMLSFWNDLLRNDYQGTGYIDKGRKQITAWLFENLAQNTRYDRFVSELVDPAPGAEGFVKGIIWRGVVNASQTPEMQAAQNVAQVFMGVNLKCASCHDSFINDWTLADAYGLASIYADEPLELVHCDKPTGEWAAASFLYPELGAIDGEQSRESRMRQLAELVTQERNGRLTRTIVNRLWAQFLGRGLVEPLDDMEQAAWNEDLLDWLAEDLAAHGYNLKHTIARILTSQAYQMPAVPAAERAATEYVFRGPLVRRLSAEQFLDALSCVTGLWHPAPDAEADFDAVAPISDAIPFWIQSAPSADDQVQTVHWRKLLELPETPLAAAGLAVAADTSFTLFVNGKKVVSGKGRSNPELVDLQPYLRSGLNAFALEMTEKPTSEDTAPEQGVLIHARFYPELLKESPLPELVSDASWRWSTEPEEDWKTSTTIREGWQEAIVIGPLDPDRDAKELRQTISATRLCGQTRVSLVNSDALMTALGRPNREQVVTRRASEATTLQALEMTNGQTLANLVQRGAQQLLATADARSTPELVRTVYQSAFGRTPKAQEVSLAVSLVGTPPEPDGLADLLWALTMLPEFQLIY